MKTLALETSAKSVSVAVTENGTLLAQAYQDRGLTHSVTLMPLLDEYHVRYENRAKHFGRQVKLTYMIIDNVEYEVID